MLNLLLASICDLDWLLLCTHDEIGAGVLDHDGSLVALEVHKGNIALGNIACLRESSKLLKVLGEGVGADVLGERLEEQRLAWANVFIGDDRAAGLLGGRDNGVGLGLGVLSSALEVYFILAWV